MQASRIPDASIFTSWRRSSYSGSENGACVEVVDNLPGVTPVRDSKVPEGPALVLPEEAWSAFLAGVKGGDLSVFVDCGPRSDDFIARGI